MQPTQKVYGVGDLLEKVADGKIALPDFQRPYRWRPSDVAELLRSMARGWPVGSFLLLELGAKAPMATRRIEGGRVLKKPELMVLDGQQRITAIYQALTDNAEDLFYVRIKDTIDDKEFSDDHLLFTKKQAFFKQWPRAVEQVQEGVIPVSSIWDDQAFADWVNVLDRSDQQPYWDARKSFLAGLADYQVPALQLPEGVPLPILARIFEDINRRGRPLKTFDLMFARLFPGRFNLRDRALTALKSKSELHEYFDYPNSDDAHEDFAMEVLKVIALKEFVDGPATKRNRVKGVRESDVLDLNATTVREAWPSAVRNYAAAIEFLKTNCGVVRSNLLPSRPMVITVAFALSKSGARRDWKGDLKRWYFASCLRQSYGQAANTQTTRDAAALSAWLADRHARPADLQNFRAESLDDLLNEARPRHEIALRALLCLQVLNNARDWVTGTRLAESEKSLEFHHCFSKGFWANHEKSEAKRATKRECLSNFAVIEGATNGKIRDETPRTVVARNDVKRGHIESHSIDYETFAGQKFAAFRAARVKALRNLAVEAVEP